MMFVWAGLSVANCKFWKFARQIHDFKYWKFSIELKLESKIWILFYFFLQRLSRTLDIHKCDVTK